MEDGVMETGSHLVTDGQQVQLNTKDSKWAAQGKLHSLVSSASAVSGPGMGETLRC